jgi:hypothetical protein
LLRTVKALRVLDPTFVSVTHGALGSSRARAVEVEVAKRIKAELDIDVYASSPPSPSGMQHSLLGSALQISLAGLSPASLP